MKKLITLTLLGMLMSAPAFAADPADVPADADNIKADVGAIQKDNAASQKDKDTLARDRAAKAAAKANGSMVDQVGNSLAIGADKTAITEKQTEKDADKQILQHHKKALDEDASDQQ